MTPTLTKELLDIVHAYAEIEQAADRACAITACAILDDRIEMRISNRLLQDQGALKKFFDLRSGITAETRIILGYLVGVYTNETRVNLVAMSQIRNKFAHRMDVRGFDHAALDGAFKNITLCQRLTKHSEFVKGGDFEKFTPAWTRRDKFIATTKLILHWLANDHADHAPYPEFSPRF